MTHESHMVRDGIPITSKLEVWLWNFIYDINGSKIHTPMTSKHWKSSRVSTYSVPHPYLLDPSVTKLILK